MCINVILCMHCKQIKWKKKVLKRFYARFFLSFSFSSLLLWLWLLFGLSHCTSHPKIFSRKTTKQKKKMRRRNDCSSNQRTLWQSHKFSVCCSFHSYFVWIIAKKKSSNKLKYKSLLLLSTNPHTHSKYHDEIETRRRRSNSSSSKQQRTNNNNKIEVRWKILILFWLR